MPGNTTKVVLFRVIVKGMTGKIRAMIAGHAQKFVSDIKEGRTIILQ